MCYGIDRRRWVQTRLRAFQAMLLWMAIAIALPSVLGTGARWVAAQEHGHACQCPMAKTGAPCACPACRDKPGRLALLYGSLRDKCDDDHWIAPQAVDLGLMPPANGELVMAFELRAPERLAAPVPQAWDHPPPVPPPRLASVA
jgi:hypothetical protein